MKSPEKEMWHKHFDSPRYLYVDMLNRQLMNISLELSDTCCNIYENME
jgi:hypothetical protein